MPDISPALRERLIELGWTPPAEEPALNTEGLTTLDELTDDLVRAEKDDR